MPPKTNGESITSSPPRLSNAEARLVAPLFNNLYWVHRDIVAAIAHAIPNRPDEDVVWLAVQLAREAGEVPIYRRLLDAIGMTPDPSIRINDSRVRYRELRETEDPVVLAIGMNVVAQGTLGIIEHELLYQRFPDLLGGFPPIIAGMNDDLDTAITYLRTQPEDRVHAELRRLWTHLHRITVPELTPLLQPIIAGGVFPDTIVRDSIDRFLKIADRLGVPRHAFDD